MLVPISMIECIYVAIGCQPHDLKEFGNHSIFPAFLPKTPYFMITY